MTNIEAANKVADSIFEAGETEVKEAFVLSFSEFLGSSALTDQILIFGEPNCAVRLEDLEIRMEVRASSDADPGVIYLPVSDDRLKNWSNCAALLDKLKRVIKLAILNGVVEYAKMKGNGRIWKLVPADLMRNVS